MSSTHTVYTIILFVACYSYTCYSTSTLNNAVLIFDGKKAIISLKSYNKLDINEQAFSQSMFIDGNKTVTIEVTDVPNVLTFFIIQIHSYQYNVSLSYDDTFTPRKYTFGTNLGLVIDLVGTSNNAAVPPFLTYLRNDNYVQVQTLIAVVAYTKNAPIPGGCNMEFETEIAPYQKLIVTDSMVKVDIQAAGTPKLKGPQISCEKNGLRHEMYQLFLPEQDFTTDTYFSTIENALTVQRIITNFRKIPPSGSGSKMRRVYSAYPGTGSLYAAVAVMGNHTAAYVPAFTYACSPLYWTDTCQVLTSTFPKVLCAVALFLGLFVTFVGHKYFKTEMFLLGFLSGGLVSYIIIAVVGDIEPTGNIGISVFLGCVLGFTWLGFWWLYAIPVLSILLATLTLGFFCASIAYFSSPAGIFYIENDANFWSIFVLIILCVPLTLSVVPDSANIICCAILGSYAVIIPIDHYAGSNLKYIIINIMRRATLPGFNVAVVHPPFQMKDTLLTFCWVILAIAGICIQLRENRGKPPFPPGMPISSSTATESRILQNERTPLLVESRIPDGTLQSDDDVFESPRRKWYSGFSSIPKSLRTLGGRV